MSKHLFLTTYSRYLLAPGVTAIPVVLTRNYNQFVSLSSRQDQALSTPSHSRKRRRATRFCAREIEGSIVMAPVEEDMLRYSHTESPKTCKKVQQYVLPTECISRDVFTNAWLDSFTVTT